MFKNELAAQVAQRRTFAIISHPDAGKTTMTEKLLLWGQAIQIAGMVKSRKSDRAANVVFRSPPLSCSFHLKTR